MPKIANPNNVYSLTCKVSGIVTKTNPTQFNNDCIRYGLTREEMIDSYVCVLGRKHLATEKLTPEQAAEKYKLHMNVTNKLKSTIKPQKIKVKIPNHAIITEPTTNNTFIRDDQEVVYDVSNEIPETTLA